MHPHDFLSRPVVLVGPDGWAAMRPVVRQEPDGLAVGAECSEYTRSGEPIQRRIAFFAHIPNEGRPA